MTARAKNSFAARERAGALDPDEDDAVNAAAAAMVEGQDARDAAYRCISAWIARRAELSAGKRLVETVAFDLQDARLRGLVSASLARIGAALSLPADVAFFELSREQAVDVFVTALAVVREASLRAGESPGVLDDALPF